MKIRSTRVRLSVASFIFLVVGLVSPHALGHSGHSADGARKERTWHLASSPRAHFHGSFVSEKEGRVVIRRADDSLRTLKLEELSQADQDWIAQRNAEIQAAQHIESSLKIQGAPMSLEGLPWMLAAQGILLQTGNGNQRLDRPSIADAFEPFVRSHSIKTRWDDQYFYVESNGIPQHRMMVGITSWQQQVPLPQAYVGDNAWRVPLHPVPAKKPLTTKNRFLRGAIALAANGIPIFNPLNNRGDDAFLFGELDEFGGHCGRADDYHYHIAPTHLQKEIGPGLPIAYALDGYPIYGYEEPDGSPVRGLDAFNGHVDEKGNYHYHATKTYPYLNGGFHGEVVERGGQVDPQPRAEPIRPDLRPLRDAKIVDFKETQAGSYELVYDIKGKKGTVSYVLLEDGSVRFAFTDPSGKTNTESYSPKRRSGSRQPPPPPPKKEPSSSEKTNVPPRNNSVDQDKSKEKSNSVEKDNGIEKGNGVEKDNGVEKGNGTEKKNQLRLTSSAFEAGKNIPAEFTCDGAKASPPLSWEGEPEGTKFYAISLWHTAPDQEKSYWIVYNIPADIHQLEKNSKNIGKMGLNDKRRNDYDPMCSKGPGVKKYHITLYALSAEPKLSPDKATRANLRAAIKDITLAEVTLDFTYERKGTR